MDSIFDFINNNSISYKGDIILIVRTSIYINTILVFFCTVFQGAFSKYDKRNDATMRFKNLIKALRKLGQNPTEDKVYSIHNTLRSMGKYLYIYNHILKDIEAETKCVKGVVSAHYIH